MDTALIFVGTQQKGFLMSLGERLGNKYKIIFVAKSNHIARLIDDLVQGAHVEVEPDVFEINDTVCVKACREYEDKYGELFSMLCSQERGIGYGYLSNVDQYPLHNRANWTQEKKYSSIYHKFKYLEGLFERYKPKIVVTHSLDKITWLVSKYYSVSCFGLGMIKYKDRYFWYDQAEYTSKRYQNRLHHYLSEYRQDCSVDEIQYEQELSSKYSHSKLDYSWKSALRNSSSIITHETVKIILGYKKKYGYRYLGWLPSLIRRPRRYRYLMKYGVRPEQLRDRKIVFFPMHLEPEIALMRVSPEFTNSYELVSMVSKSLPADHALVIREHPFSIGVRSANYYDMLRRIPNVYLACPDIQSLDWIKRSGMVATITGTAAIEAVYYERPVLSFGKHQAVNILPTVYYVNSYDTTRKAIENIKNLEDKDQLQRSKWALHQAQMDVSFSLPGFEKTYHGVCKQDELAKIAVEKLMELV